MTCERSDSGTGANADKRAGRIEELHALCESFGLRSLYVFGSRSRELLDWCSGDRPTLQWGGSDVDIGVMTAGPSREHELSVLDKVRLTIALEDLFRVRRVDLVTFAEVDAFLALNVIRGERLYVRNRRPADEFELYVLRRAAHLEPLARARQAMVLGGER
jgi:predicted nucleotidyltransferase